MGMLTRRLVSSVLLVLFVIAFSVTGCAKNDGGTSSTASKSQAASISKSKAPSVSAAKQTASPGAGSAVGTSSARASASSTVSGADGGQTGETDNSSAGDGEGAADSTGQPVVDSSTEFGETVTQIDLKGRTILWGNATKTALPSPTATDTKSKLFYENLKKIEQKYNCKFEFVVPASQTIYINEIKSKALSGTEDRDICNTMMNYIAPDLVEGGYYLALENYISKDTVVWQDLIEGLSIWNGKHYGITEQGTLKGGNQCTFYNTEIFARHGIPDLWEYVDKGIWTWDTFLDVAIETTVDFNGDGIVDQWGLMSKPETMAPILFYANGGKYMEGDFKFALNSPKVIKALQFMSDLYNVYRVTTIYNAKVLQTGNAAMCIHNSSGLAGMYTHLDIIKKIGVAPAPRGPDMPVYIQGYNHGDSMYSIPASAKEPEKLIVVISDLFYTRFLDYKAEGPLKIAAEIWYKDCPDNIARVLKISDIADTVYCPEVGVFSDMLAKCNTEIFTKVINQEMPVTTALSASESMMQSLIDAKLRR